MILATLAALALQAAAPEAAAPAATPATPPAATASLAASTPNGAPADDYGFVAWCRGALTGHMELYASVKPELARVEAEKAERQNAKLSGDALKTAKAKQAKDLKESEAGDVAQLKAGKDYVTLYGQALDAAEASAPESLHARGQKEIAEGYRIWAAARAAGARDRMWSWLMWELPARCETAARSLKSNAGLFGDAYKTTEAPPAAAPTSDAPVPNASVPDAPVSDAPVSDAPAADTSAAPPPTDAPATTAPAAEPPVPALRPAEPKP